MKEYTFRPMDTSCHAELVSASQNLEIPNRVRNDNKAFTLAEVLITLTIIGVIAALTIPNLMQKWSDNADVVKVKEAYSIFNNALKIAIAENGPTDTWSESTSTTLSKYLKIKENCENSGPCLLYGYDSNNQKTSYGTWNSYWRRMDGGVSSYGGPNCQGGNCGVVLTNGMRARINNDILVDINGVNNPNQYGYDVFYFSIQNNTLVPEHSRLSGKSRCNKNSADAKNNLSCAYWIIKHGNMDYKYRDVSAEW